MLTRWMDRLGSAWMSLIRVIEGLNRVAPAHLRAEGRRGSRRAQRRRG